MSIQNILPTIIFSLGVLRTSVDAAALHCYYDSNLRAMELKCKKKVSVLTPRLIASSGDKRAGSFFAQRISLAIQRGNAASILGTIPHGHYLHSTSVTFENYTEISLDNPESMLNSSGYNSTRHTVFCTHGFISDTTSDSVKDLVEYYLHNRNRSINICSLDWKKEASGGLLGLVGYGKAVRETISVGKKFGQAIIKLLEAGLELEKIDSLIGFSLGAHLVAYAAKEVQTTKRNISKVIGLDPAGPLYQGLISYEGLNASCADFVMALHTNPGGLGTAESVGTVDIWANCGNIVQPGCIEDTLKLEVPCSHSRAYEYYTEALETPNSFIASAACSCSSWKTQEGNNKTISILHDIDTSARGDYYLETNSKPKYGKGINGSVHQ